MTRYIATKARTRHYGYTVQDVTGKTTYFVGAGCTGGWYKYKRDAQKAADVMNRAAGIPCSNMREFDKIMEGGI